MKKQFLLVPLLLCFAALRAASSVLPDRLDSLGEEGWTEVQPGVMQRTLEDGKVETLGFGEVGLRFRLEELEMHLTFLQKEYSLHPSRSLRRAIRAQRGEVLRGEAALRKADAAGGLGSARESLFAEGTDCPVQYDAAGDAHPLTQGANASASASFENGCGYTGEVYAHAYARATAANNAVSTMTLSDPAPNTSRIGGQVSAAAAAGVNGVKDCYSYAYSSVISYETGVSYSFSAENFQCSGTTGVRPFAPDAPSNVALPAAPRLDPNSAAIVANLNASWHSSSLYEYGLAVFDASAGTPRTIVCTESWGGTCGASLQPVPIHASWKPSSGDGLMTVIDYTRRKVYDLLWVARNADGTVKINANGTVSVGWGNVSDLDGTGHSSAANSAGLSPLFGRVRVFEMARAASNPANTIDHALAFTSKYACRTYRYPATKSGGSSTVAGCIPLGARIFLDSGADCSTVSPVGEKAVCYALQKYGAYAVGGGGSPFSILFETPTGGQPGGSGPDPYPGAGFDGDYHDLAGLPWSRLKVAADCRCSLSDLAHTSGRAFAEKAAGNVPLPLAPKSDVNSAMMVANLNATWHSVSLYEYGLPVFDASAGTPRAIVCTEDWGVTCEASLQPVPIHAGWKPSTGDAMMTVIDYTRRKVYDFQRVATNADGTVKINANGTVSVGWGNVSDLDGNGHSPVANSDGQSPLFGTVRVFEMEHAGSDPANAIQHALSFSSKYACATYRYPATRSSGSYTGTGCIPMGSRVFLDSTADCSTVSPAGEKALCYTLQKYGAYLTGSGGSPFSILFEAPSGGQPGGSAADPYPGVGLAGDYYNPSHIPWAKLKVAPDCQCTPY